ncbi:MAG: hypothetical protein K6F58_03865 [Bacteroidales bacterium]|nr:hypothetical protein [Bacteroidales bacterium]
MKKVLLSACLLAFSLLGLSAQETIPVNFQGEKPTISDLAWAYVNYATMPEEGDEEEEEGYFNESIGAVKNAMSLQRANKALGAGETLSIDQRNGFVLYEWKGDDNARLRVEMCYWNESDGQHRLFACGVYYFDGDKYSAGQFDGLTFYRYENATKKMALADDFGFDVEYFTDDDASVTYDLPRSGKNITVNYWYQDGTRKQKTLQFDGRRFHF